MPLYGTAPYPKAIYPGDSELVFNAESPTTGQASVSLAIGSIWDNSQPAVCLELSFSGAPGTFEFDIQEADTDTANNYISPTGGQITTVNANNVARIDLSPFLGKFVRVLCKTQTQNVVTVTAKVSRAA